MLKKIQIGLTGIGVAVFMVAGYATQVAAHETETTDSTVHSKAEAAKQRVQGRLDEAKKKVCTNRSTAIQKIMQNAAAMGQRHLETFTKISTRVQEFYTNKKLSVSNYDQLVAAVNAKKAAASTAIQAVKDVPTIDCNGDNPVGVADQFKGKVKAMHQALKDYRAAIKDLIVAVKNAAGKTEGGAQ